MAVVVGPEAAARAAGIGVAASGSSEKAAHLAGFLNEFVAQALVFNQGLARATHSVPARPSRCLASDILHSYLGGRTVVRWVPGQPSYRITDNGGVSADLPVQVHIDGWRPLPLTFHFELAPGPDGWRVAEWRVMRQATGLDGLPCCGAASTAHDGHPRPSGRHTGLSLAPGPPPDLVDIAAFAESLAPLAYYARAALKETRWLRRHPELTSAVTLAAMMSSTAASLAAALGPVLRSNPQGWLQAFQESLDARGLVPRPPEVATPFLASRPHAVRYGRARVLLPEELNGPGHANATLGSRRGPGLSFGLAGLYLAVLRLAGAPPETTAQLNVTTASGQHAGDVVVAALGDMPFLIEDGRVEPWDSGKLHHWRRIARAFNDATCIDERYGAVGSAPCADRLAGMLQTHFPTFDMGVVRRPADGPGHPPELAPWAVPPLLREVTGAAALADEVRRRVFLRSAEVPASVTTAARYAYQTLLVDRPEAYALAAATGLAARLYAARPSPLEHVLNWMRRHLRPGSIFPEPDRVMLPEQVLMARLGRPLDRALLLFGLLASRAVARVVQTTRGAYVLMKDRRGVRLIDAARAAITDHAEGVLVLAFDACRQYGPRDGWNLEGGSNRIDFCRDAFTDPLLVPPPVLGPSLIRRSA